MRTAVIFDLNGTLVDDMAFHEEAWFNLARELDRALDPSIFSHELAGASSAEILAYILGRTPSVAELEELVERKEVRYRAAYGPRLAEVPGSVALVRRLRAGGVPLAVATLAPAANRTLALGGLGIVDAFDQVFGAEHVTRGKPAPDIFLAAAAALGVAPEQCVVFEDGVPGVTGAKAAGMYAVGVTTVIDGPTLLAAGANEVVPDYRALPAGLLARIGL